MLWTIFGGPFAPSTEGLAHARPNYGTFAKICQYTFTYIPIHVLCTCSTCRLPCIVYMQHMYTAMYCVHAAHVYCHVLCTCSTCILPCIVYMQHTYCHVLCTYSTCILPCIVYMQHMYTAMYCVHTAHVYWYVTCMCSYVCIHVCTCTCMSFLTYRLRNSRNGLRSNIASHLKESA